MQPKAVLLLNDDPEFLDALGSVLEGEGFPVVTANSGPDALDRLQDIQPVLIMTDFRLPAADGLAFLSELRARGLYEDVPKLILSAEAPELLAARQREAGTDVPSLHKLTDLPALLQVIRDAFDAGIPRIGVPIEA